MGNLLVIRDPEALVNSIACHGYSLREFATNVLDVDVQKFQSWLVASRMPFYYATKIDNFFGLTGTKMTLFKTEEELHPIENDPVNHPSHYTTGSIETIDFIQDKNLNFCRGNAVKYIVRAGLKDPKKTVEDLEKAIWYINAEIKQIRRGKHELVIEQIPYRG